MQILRVSLLALLAVTVLGGPYPRGHHIHDGHDHSHDLIPIRRSEREAKVETEQAKPEQDLEAEKASDELTTDTAATNVEEASGTAAASGDADAMDDEEQKRRRRDLAVSSEENDDSNTESGDTEDNAADASGDVAPIAEDPIDYEADEITTPVPEEAETNDSDTD